MAKRIHIYTENIMLGLKPTQLIEIHKLAEENGLMDAVFVRNEILKVIRKNKHKQDEVII